MTQLIETRWIRYGKDRVYLKTADGDDVGDVDLVARTFVAKVPDYEAELQMCLARRTGTADQLTTANVAGAAARAKRNEVTAQAPVMNLVARVLGVKTDERAWRVGAKGEEKVADELSKLDAGWRVLHAVEVGENGSDIDPVVIWPSEVSTLKRQAPPSREGVGGRTHGDGERSANRLPAQLAVRRAALFTAPLCRVRSGGSSHGGHRVR